MIVCPIVYLYPSNRSSAIYLVFFDGTDRKGKEEISMVRTDERDMKSLCPGLHPERLFNLMRGSTLRESAIGLKRRSDRGR